MADKLAIPTRDKLIADYERDYRLRLPDSRVGEGTLPGIDARLLSDQVLPLYAEASRMADDAILENKTLDDLKLTATELGLVELLPAVGASGEVIAVTSGGGATVLAGTLATHEATGLRYQCTETDLYFTDDRIPVQCVDTGPNTNLPVGSTLKWTSPPAGLSQNSLVGADGQGNGLTGGRSEESRTELIQRISNALANPPVAGNAAEYVKKALETPGVAVQQPFTYPCILGPGTIGLTFTLRPEGSGANRIPSAPQRAAVKAHVIGQMPTDDSIFDVALVSEPTTICYRVRWRAGTVGWKDATPWPAYETNRVTVAAAPAPTPTTFRLETTGAPGNPQVGQTIAMYDAENKTFRAKRIATVTGTGPWDITCDTTNTASDTSFTPTAGVVVCPWSDLLSTLVEPTIASFDGLGPGEQIASYYDTGGQRQRRDPFSPNSYPSELTGRITIPIYALTSIDEVHVAVPTLPSATAVGTPGVTSNLKELTYFAAYPL